ncbi:unnamed protein product [Closterium sp. Yama58-4]|nr:unnamed protein product [Closterium sp. Yama58-4]
MATWLPEPTPNQDPLFLETSPQARPSSHYTTTTASAFQARSNSHEESQSQSREQFYRHSNQPRGRPTSRPRSRSRSKSGRKGGSSTSTSASAAPSSSAVSSGPAAASDLRDLGNAGGAADRERDAGDGGGGGELTRGRSGASEALARRGGGLVGGEGRERAAGREAGGGQGSGSRGSYRVEPVRDYEADCEVVVEWRRGERCRESVAVGVGSMRKQAAGAGDVAQHGAGGVRRSSDGAMADLESRSPIRTQRLKETMSDATHQAKPRSGSASGPLPAHKGGITRGRFQVIEGDQSDSESDMSPWPSATTPSGKAETPQGTPTAAAAGSSGPLLGPSPFTAAAATAASAAHAAAAAAAAAGAGGSGGGPAAAGKGVTPSAVRRISTAGSASSSSSPYYSPASRSPTAPPNPAPADLRHGPLPGFAGPLRFEGGSGGGSWRGTGGSSGSASGVDAGQRSTGSGGSGFDGGQQRTGSSESLCKEVMKPGSSGGAPGRGVGGGAWERGSGAEAGDGGYSGEGYARGEQERGVEEWAGKEGVRQDGWAGARDVRDGSGRDGAAGREGAGRAKARSEPLVGEKAAAAAGVGGARRSAHVDMMDRSQREEGPAAAAGSGSVRSKAPGSMVSRSAPLPHPQAPVAGAAAASSGTPKRGAVPTGDGQDRWKEKPLREERGREERGREERGREERNLADREADGRRAGGVEKDRKSGGREREARKSDDKTKERTGEERSEQGRGGQEGRRKEESVGKESARAGRSREERGREGEKGVEKGREEEKGRQERERGQAHGRGVGRVGVQRRGRFSVTTDDVDAQDGAPPTVMCTSSMHRPHPQAARLLPPGMLFPRAPLAMHPPAVCTAPPLLPARRISTHQATSRPPLPAPAPLLPSPVAVPPTSLPVLPAALVADALLLVPHLRTLLQHSCEQQEVLFNLIKELAAAHPGATPLHTLLPPPYLLSLPSIPFRSSPQSIGERGTAATCAAGRHAGEAANGQGAGAHAQDCRDAVQGGEADRQCAHIPQSQRSVVEAGGGVQAEAEGAQATHGRSSSTGARMTGRERFKGYQKVLLLAVISKSIARFDRSSRHSRVYRWYAQQQAAARMGKMGPPPAGREDSAELAHAADHAGEDGSAGAGRGSGRDAETASGTSGDAHTSGAELRVLEFYSGIGGLHYGLQCPGVVPAHVTARVVAAFDINEVANDVYERNFRHRPKQGNVQTMSAAALDAWRAHAWLMSPPCQPYTRQGLKRDCEDGRATSFLAMLQRLPAMQHPPLFILVENVLGFESSRTRHELVRVLTGTGFTSLHEFLLSPTDLALPYSRPRYFCLAKRTTPLAAALCHSLPGHPSSSLSTAAPEPHTGTSRAEEVPGGDASGAVGQAEGEREGVGEEGEAGGEEARGDGVAAAGVLGGRDLLWLCQDVAQGEWREQRAALQAGCSDDSGSSGGGDGAGLASECGLKLRCIGDFLDSHPDAAHGSDDDNTGADDSSADVSAADGNGASKASACEAEVPSAQSSASPWVPYCVPHDVRQRWGECFDIVTAASVRCNCFTKSYTKYAKGTGSVLLTQGAELATRPPAAAASEGACVGDSDPTSQALREQPSTAEEQPCVRFNGIPLTHLPLRYFTPREVANLHNFPRTFTFPPHVTMKQRYALLGNSVSVAVVAHLLRHLFTMH